MLELAPHGIRVASVAPGVIQTPILENIAAEARERLRAGIPVGRFGDPGEVWLALRFVLECGFFTSRSPDPRRNSHLMAPIRRRRTPGSGTCPYTLGSGHVEHEGASR